MSVNQIKTYRELIASGILKGRRKQVYEALKRCPMTNIDLCKYLELPINSVCGRTSELHKAGAIEICGSAKNPYSGQLISVYRVSQLDLL